MPSSSLQIITEENPRLKYYYKMKSLLQNLVFKILITEQETLYANKIFPPQFSIKIQKIHTKLKNASHQICHILDWKSKNLLKDF